MIFSLLLISLQDNWTKAKTMYLGVYNICKSKMYDNESTEDNKKEIELYYRKDTTLMHYVWGNTV